MTTEIANFVGGRLDVGDGRPAREAFLSRATGLAYAAGRLFIADRGNNRVRAVDLDSSIITTIAGTGQAVSATGGVSVEAGARLATETEVRPVSLAHDSGHLYISDFDTHRVHRLELATGLITALVGTGIGGYSGDGGASTAAQLNTPRRIAVDAGQLYVCDGGNHRIRAVDLATGRIRTVAGNGVAGCRGDGGPATEACLHAPYAVASRGGCLYIADTNNDRIRKVELRTGIISTLAAGSATRAEIEDAELPWVMDPRALAVDEACENLYISEFTAYGTGLGGARVCRLHLPTGTVTIVAGNGFPDYTGDGGPATSASLNGPCELAIDARRRALFIADVGNSRIRRVDLDAGIITTYAGSNRPLGDGGPASEASLNSPTQLAVDPVRGSIYICDASNQRVRAVDLATRLVSTVAGTGDAGYAGDGGPATRACFNSPFGLACDGTNLYVSDRFNNVVRRVHLPSGEIRTIAGTGVAGLHPDGDLATHTPITDPRGLALDPTGRYLFIAQYTDERVRCVDLVTGIVTTVAGTGTAGDSGDGGPAREAKVYNPTGVCFHAGSLYIADRVNHRIRAVDDKGIITTVAGTGVGGFSGDGGPAVRAQLNNPIDCAVDRSGALYITDSANHRIRKLDRSGTITTVFGGSEAHGDLNTPFGLLLLGSELYISEFANHRVQHVSLAPTELQETGP
jgi:DNA-binding beta-propeller fold protein YncE